MKKSLKQRLALFMAAALMFSLVYRPGIARAAGGQQTPQPASVELVAVSENGVVSVTQGTTSNFNILLSVTTGNGNIDATVTINTKYYLSRQGSTNNITSDTPQIYTFNNKNNTVTVPVQVAVSSNYSTANHSVPINIIVTNKDDKGTQLVNNTPDSFTITVLSSDIIAPIVTISSPVNNTYYNSSNLPASPVYTVVEANQHAEIVTGWERTEGTHTVTVTSTDAYGNVGSASATYTVDNTAPTISTTIADGGVYNEATLKNMGKYYSIQDTNLDPDTESGTPLVYTEGEHTATVTATDKAGNVATKIIKYVVDNTKPEIKFNFNDGGFYRSDYPGFYPYYNVSDAHLDKVTAPMLDLAEGNHSVEVSASDLAGNSNSSTASYIVDDTAPTVTINLVPNNFYNRDALNALDSYYTANDTNLLNVDATPLEKDTDGAYEATVKATDKAGNETTKSVSYNVDNTMPVITFNEKLVNGGFYQSSTLTDIKNSFFTATDANIASVSEVALDLTEGSHTITVKAVDKAGNETNAQINYIIDDIAPTINFNVENGKFYTSDNLTALLGEEKYYSTSDNNEVVSVVVDALVYLEGSHTLTVTAMDAAGNKTTASVTYTIDNTKPVIEFIISNNSFYKSTKLAEILNGNPYYITTDNNAVVDVAADDLQISEEGTYTLSVTASDAAGNATTSTVTYTIDNTAPVVSFNIEAGSFLTSARLAEILGENTYYNASDKNGLVEFAPPALETSEGSHTLSVTAKDAAGNETTESITYTIDDTNPVITTKLVEGGIYNEDTLKNMGEYYSIIETNLGTESATDLNYSEGNHTAIITATDKAGNTASVTINYTVDNTKPEITFNFNDNGFYQSKVLGALGPYYNVSDDNPDEGSIVADEFDLSEGKHSVTVSASDLAGNSNSATASYTVDDTAPEITLKIEADKFYNKDALSKLGDYYTVVEANPLTTEASDLEMLVDGNYTVTVTATDKAGNKTTNSVSYNVDNTEPVITFNEKFQNGGYYQSSVLESIKDNLYKATDANLDSVSADELDLTEGQHTITVKAVDKAGNETTKTITYTVDNTAPGVSVIGITDGQRFIAGQKVEVIWNATDTNLDSSETGNITLDTTTAGEKTIKIPAAIDKAGNATPAQTIKYYVYNFSGVLQPIKADGKSSFKSGSTVPVKFQLFDGAKYITDANATIRILKVSGSAILSINEAVSTSAATDGSLFRYDSSDNQYIFNLSTKNYSEGQYKVEITITVDGTTTVHESPVFTIKR